VIKILLADDYYIVRKVLRSLLESEKDFEIVGEAANGLETVELGRSLQPDILLLDLMMPGINGLEVISRLARICPQIRIIIISMHSNEAYVNEAFRRGAKAYVLKEAAADELVTAVRRVKDGAIFVSSSLQMQPQADLQNKSL
jgi:DNA-binding NarL/FixJ family response regulator